MGKEWDTIRPEFGNWNDDKWTGRGLTRKEGKATEGRPSNVQSLSGATPSFHYKANLRCRRCNRWSRGGSPCECSNPDWEPRPNERALAMQTWHQAWATEALRVLKPGGHLLAFGGTRTYHRLACAVEDAGFEIRDSVIWLYGSGFPKSLDVSKAIDRLNGKPLERMREFGVWMRSQREAAGLTAAEVNRKMEMPQGCGWWEGKGAGDKWDLHPPSLATFAQLKKLYGSGDEWDWFVEWAEAQREDLGVNPFNAIRGRSTGTHTIVAPQAPSRITAPATPEAQRWQGWGTALKPSHEPVVCAQKPLGIADWLAIIGSHLDRLESEWQAQEADPTTPTGEGADSSDQMATSPSESPATTSSSIVTSWRKCWAELSGAMSMSTTETATRLITDLETLSSCLEALTVESIPLSPSPTSGSPSLVVAVDNLFAAAVLSLRGILALSAGGPATESTAHPSPDGGAASPSPAHEPIVVARKPLIGTVAQNVERFGTGALNVDACRVEGAVPKTIQGASSNIYGGGDGLAPDGYQESDPHPAGRWPANCVLSHIGPHPCPDCAGSGHWYPRNPEGERVSKHCPMCLGKGELPGCQRVGERRVKGSHDQGKADIRGEGGDGWGFNAEGGQGYADPDGLETVEAWRCEEGCPILELDRQSGELKSPKPYERNSEPLGNPRIYGQGAGIPQWSAEGNYGDTGGASRFFYVAKASRAERNAGLEGFEERESRRYGDRNAGDLPKQTGQGVVRGANTHPT